MNVGPGPLAGLGVPAAAGAERTGSSEGATDFALLLLAALVSRPTGALAVRSGAAQQAVGEAGQPDGATAGESGAVTDAATLGAAESADADAAKPSGADTARTPSSEQAADVAQTAGDAQAADTAALAAMVLGPAGAPMGSAGGSTPAGVEPTDAAPAEGARLDPDRDPSKLDPEFRARLERVVERMRDEHGFEVMLVEGYRDPARQQQLYAQGRSRPGPVVTWTTNSLHSRGLAADVVVDGRYDNPAGYAALARIAREEGLRTLGPQDPGHLEMADAMQDSRYARSARSTAEPTGSPGLALGQLRVAAPARPTPAPPAGPAAVANVARLVQARPAAPAQPGALVRGLTRADARGIDGRTAPPVSAADALATNRVAPDGTAMGPDARSLAGVARADDLTAEIILMRAATVQGRAGEAPGANRTPNGAAAQPTPFAGALEDLDAQIANTVRRAYGMDQPAGGESTAGASSPSRDVSGALMGAGGPVARAPLGPDAVDVTLGASTASRIAQVEELQAQTSARPLSQILVHLDDVNGAPATIRVGVRGAAVDATLDVGDRNLAERISADLGELRTALERQGLEPASLRVRSTMPHESPDPARPFANASAAATEPARPSIVAARDPSGAFEREHDGQPQRRRPDAEPDRQRSRDGADAEESE